MDIFGSHQTPLLVLSNIIALFYFYVTLKPALINPSIISKKRINTIEILMLLFCLFSFWGTDWFGYKNYFISVKSGWGDYVPMEDVYIWLMETLPSYILFRLVVWGGALLLLRKTISNFGINVKLFYFFFCGISLIWFAYARASLAMAMLFCGVSYIMKGQNSYGKKTVNFTIGVTLVICSFYFHKSAVIGIAAIALAVFLRKLGTKNGIRFLLVSFPFIVAMVQGVFSGFFDNLTSDETNVLNEYAVAGAAHLDSNKTAQGIGIIIEHFLEWVPSYLLVYICIKTLYTKKAISNEMSLLMYSLCSIVFVSSVFAFDLGTNTQTIYVRMMRYSQIPLCICLAYMYENGLYLKQVKWVYTLGIAGCIYATSYMLYNIIVG